MRNSEYKWNLRPKRKQVFKINLEKYSVNLKRHLTIEFGHLLKKFTAWCNKCHLPFYPEHLETHGVQRIRIKQIFEDLDNLLNCSQTKESEIETKEKNR